MKPSDEIINDIIKMVGKNVKDSPELIPTFFVGKDKKFDVLAAPFRSNEEKNLISRYIKAKVQNENADFVLFISEAYVLQVKDHKNWRRERDKYDSLADHPDAKEVVTFVFETPNRVWGAQADILPNRDMGPVEWDEMSKAEGRFANFFGADKPTVQ